MSTTKNSFIMLAVSLAFGYSGIAIADDAWKLRKDKNNIQVYTRRVEGSPYDAVKTITVMQEVKLASLVALIEDLDACPDWADRCAQAYVYRRVSDTEAYVYTHNEMPFPVKDRDVLAHVTWSQDPTSYEVVMMSVATEGEMKKVKGRLRLTNAKAKWRFKPLASGGVQVMNEAHIDPGSSLPGWIINMLLVNTPFETMKSFVSEVMKPKYKSASVDFIKEPPTQQELKSAGQKL